MKAPRKTPKRPIPRYIERIEKDVKIEIKDDENNINLVVPEKKNSEIDKFDTPIIEFENVIYPPPLDVMDFNLFKDMEDVLGHSLTDVINSDADLEHIIDNAFDAPF